MSRCVKDPELRATKVATGPAATSKIQDVVTLWMGCIASGLLIGAALLFVLWASVFKRVCGDISRFISAFWRLASISLGLPRRAYAFSIRQRTRLKYSVSLLGDLTIQVFWLSVVLNDLLLRLMWTLFECCFLLPISQYQQRSQEREETESKLLKAECLELKATRDSILSDDILPDLDLEWEPELCPLIPENEYGLLEDMSLDMGTVSEDFDPALLAIIKTLGGGACGQVSKVRNRKTGSVIAVKTLPEENGDVHNDRHFVVTEIRAMERLEGNFWVAQLYRAFGGPQNYYLLMNLFPRGDLVRLIREHGCLSRPLARFYCAELLVGIQAIHQQGNIHRDIKPENILISDDGHLTITDFGMCHLFRSAAEEAEDSFFADEFPVFEEAKRLGGDYFPLLCASVDNPHTTYGMSGTPVYAPFECIRETDLYSYGVDYYSMGVVFHEMVTGVPPLRGDQRTPLYMSIARIDDHIQFISLLERDFLNRVLADDPFTRPSVSEMKSHPIFSEIDWVRLNRRELPIPPQTAIRKRVDISDATVSDDMSEPEALMEEYASDSEC